MKGPFYFLLLSVLFCTQIFSNPIENRPVKLAFFIGKVMIKKGNDKEWKEAKIGIRLSSKDAVRTFVESKADLETEEGTIINIQENTIFGLSEVSVNSRTKAATTTVNVKSGSVWANVKKMTNQRSNFTFETPTATAAIRGTELGVDVEPGGTRVRVREGKVEVKNKKGGKAVFLFENQMAVVKKDDDNITVEPMKSDSTGGSQDGPADMNLELLSPVEGQEFASLSIPVYGKTRPKATVKISGGSEISAGEDGLFSVVISLPPDATKEQTLSVAAISESGIVVSKTVKFFVSTAVMAPPVDSVKTDSIANKADTAMAKETAKAPAVCPVEILEPAAGSEVGIDFTLKGKIDNGGGKAQVFVNGIPAQVSGNSFAAQVVTGFQKNQGGALQLSVLEPRAGAKISALPVIIRGRVSPPMAKVLIDGSREAKVFSDGTYEAEYPMSDESGDYTVEVSAIIEAGEVVKKRFDVSVQSECEGGRSPIYKTTYNVNVGSSTVAGERKMAVSFKYEKVKYPLVLQVSPPMCGTDKVSFEVKTTAVELKANGRALPIAGAGGIVKSYRYEVSNTDQDCNNNEVTFSASDEGATPSFREQTVTWNCPIRNTHKPQLQLQDNGKGLVVRVQDLSFNCGRAEEEVKVMVDATGQGRVSDFEITANGGSSVVSFINGANIVYTVKAEDKGRNSVTATYTKNGYLDKQPNIRPVNPSTFNGTKIVRANPPFPPGMSPSAEEVPVTFRIDNIEDRKLIKRVEFSASDGSKFNYEGASIPSSLEFDDITVTYKPDAIKKRGQSLVISYTIRVTDILGNTKQQQGTLTIQGK